MIHLRYHRGGAIDRFFAISVALKLDYWKNVDCFSGIKVKQIRRLPHRNELGRFQQLARVESVPKVAGSGHKAVLVLERATYHRVLNAEDRKPVISCKKIDWFLLYVDEEGA